MKQFKMMGFLIVGMLFFVPLSCKKYADGGLKSKAEKRILNSWKLDQYMRNGNDETSSLLISNFLEEYQDGGTLIRSYKDKNGDDFSETGSWQFDNDKNQINLTGVGSIELTDETSTVSTSDYNIIRMKKDELWYKYDNGGDTHEFHLVPN